MKMTDNPAEYVFAGDVGGTKINLALCEVRGSRGSGNAKVHASEVRRYSSQNFGSMSEVLGKYFEELKAAKKWPAKVRAACFGVPGPVIEGRCQTVNLPWAIDAQQIESDLNARHQLGLPILLYNDLEALAFGIQCLEKGSGMSALTSSSVKPQKSNIGLIAPGTGLGEAFLVWNGTTHLTSASEGGHCDFGPQNEEQIELLRWLWKRHKHVSWEHVASGPAIYRLFRFICETGIEKPSESMEKALSVPGIDPSPLIARAATEKSCSASVRAMDLWLFCLGAAAGNMALKSLCFGGLYIGGGVVPNILELFGRSSFFAGFESKGRMTELLKKIPIFVITNQYTALYGASLAAYNKTL